MALRLRRVKEISRLIAPLLYTGDCYQRSGRAFNFMGLFVMLSAQKPTASWIQVRGSHEHRFSTMADASHEPANEIDLLSFMKASFDELEGTHHSWLNMSNKNKQTFGEAGIFLVVTAGVMDHDVIMFEKLKTIQKRYKKDIFPHICIVGLKSIHSSADQLQVAKLLMAENITVPILLTQRTFPEIEKGAGYILFKKFRSPVIYHEKDVELEILYQAVHELQLQPNGESKLLNMLRCTWRKDWNLKDQDTYSPLQNLLLSYPGCVSSDEDSDRLFFSDCNHHRIIITNDNGEILDCIGSSPGFEDGDFISAKLGRPAGSYYHAIEDCLYFVDSENHAIRKADMGTRLVETLYPARSSSKGSVNIWNWIMDKLGLESSSENSVEETYEVFDSKSLYFPWHLLKSVDDTLYIIDRRFQTLWTMDFGSGKINEVYKGSSQILEICGQQIMKNLSILDQIPSDWVEHQSNDTFLLEGLPNSDLLSSLTTMQNHFFICDTVGQRIVKVNRESGVCSNFQLSNLGILGLPYWLNFPLETFYAAANGLLGTTIDHLQSFELLPGNIDIQLSVDIPTDIELVEPLQESCTWRQVRGAAMEISGLDDTPGALDKVGVAQQWYDELDNLAAPKPDSEMAVEDDNLNKKLVVEDEKVRINCCVFTSPGTSEVTIYAALYCKLGKAQNSNEFDQKKYAERIVDILSSMRCGKTERDLWRAYLLQSKGDLTDLIFMKPLHIRVRLSTLDHPKADNGRDIILTDSSIKVKVLLN